MPVLDAKYLVYFFRSDGTIAGIRREVDSYEEALDIAEVFLSHEQNQESCVKIFARHSFVEPLPKYRRDIKTTLYHDVVEGLVGLVDHD